MAAICKHHCLVWEWECFQNVIFAFYHPQVATIVMQVLMSGLVYNYRHMGLATQVDLELETTSVLPLVFPSQLQLSPVGNYAPLLHNLTIHDLNILFWPLARSGTGIHEYWLCSQASIYLYVPSTPTLEGYVVAATAKFNELFISDFNTASFCNCNGRQKHS